MQNGHGEIDQLDADEGRDQPAESVNQEIAPQQRGGADRPVFDALQRQRNERDDDEALMITADRIADCGEASFITLSASSSG